jgi:hypothetical protein
MMKDVDQSLGREVDVKSKVDEGGVHNEGKASFALLDDGGFEDILVIADGCVVAVCQVSLKIGFRGGGVAMGWCANTEDPVEIGPDIGVEDRAELCEDRWNVEVGIGVGPTNPADDGGDVAIKVEETRGRHGFPILSDGCDLLPVGLEALEGAEVNGGVFFAELLKLPDSKGSAL